MASPSAPRPSEAPRRHPTIHPALQAALKRMPAFTVRRWNLPLLRGMTRLGGGVGAKTEGVAIETKKSADAKVRVLRPKGADPKEAILWFHGGGLVMGHPNMADARMSRFVRELGCVVVAAHYRLAPQAPFPAAHDDAVAAWSWLLAQTKAWGLDPARLVVGGQSAGGGVAACLVQRLCDQGGQRPFGQLLVYPMLDDRTASRRDLDEPPHAVWNNGSNRFGWSSYLQQEPGAESVPRYAVAARAESLADLPPTWIGVGDADLFAEEGRRYAQSLKDAGVACEHEQVAGAFHGFDVLAPEAEPSRAFAASQIAFLRRLWA